MRPTRLLVALGACALSGSCGGPAGPLPATARGHVTYQGRPLSGGLVVFAPHPDRGPAASLAKGTVGPDGEFRLAAGGSPYLTPGWYRVAFADPPGGDGFPAGLRRPDKSGVEREVVAGRENVFAFEIEAIAR